LLLITLLILLIWNLCDFGPNFFSRYGLIVKFLLCKLLTLSYFALHKCIYIGGVSNEYMWGDNLHSFTIQLQVNSVALFLSWSQPICSYMYMYTHVSVYYTLMVYILDIACVSVVFGVYVSVRVYNSHMRCIVRMSKKTSHTVTLS
jgi:hypothetical protein